MALSDLLRISAQMPDLATGLQPGIQQAGSFLERLVRALEMLVEIERPAQLQHVYRIVHPLASGASGGGANPTPFVSRSVDVYVPVSSANGFALSWFDADGNPSTMGTEIWVYPGDYRSFSLEAKGFNYYCFGASGTMFVTWSR